MTLKAVSDGGNVKKINNKTRKEKWILGVLSSPSHFDPCSWGHVSQGKLLIQNNAFASFAK